MYDLFAIYCGRQRVELSLCILYTQVTVQICEFRGNDVVQKMNHAPIY